jgi:type III pantothenate kinase
MICTLDIGNSAVKCGLFEAGELTKTVRESHAADSVVAARRVADLVIDSGATRVGISSVVPAVSDAIETALMSGGLTDIFKVHHRSRLPFALAYETPSTMGVDRIAAAAGACSLPGLSAYHHMPIVVIDAGTATTIDVIADGSLLGGPILPGPELLRRAVRAGTAQLPTVELTWPERVISRSTSEAVGTGIMLGFVDAVRGVLLRVVDELDRQPDILVTGGWSDLLIAKVSLIGRHDPHLVVRGVASLMNLQPTADGR